MAFGETGRECRLNCSKIASSHGQADIHPIGMQGFEPTQASPDFEDLVRLPGRPSEGPRDCLPRQ